MAFSLFPIMESPSISFSLRVSFFFEKVTLQWVLQSLQRILLGRLVQYCSDANSKTAQTLKRTLPRCLVPSSILKITYNLRLKVDKIGCAVAVTMKTSESTMQWGWYTMLTWLAMIVRHFRNDSRCYIHFKRHLQVKTSLKTSLKKIYSDFWSPQGGQHEICHDEISWYFVF